MTKSNRFKALFAPHFVTKNLLIKGKATDFKCPFLSSCKVQKEDEPIWSPAFGDENTRVMIVAEAPSKRKKSGGGPHIAGRFKDFAEKGALKSLLNFVIKYYHTTPYFTDLMKCGVAKQERDLKKAVFPIRTKNCSTLFLLKEIAIINPELILCTGKTSYDFLSGAKRDGLLKNTKVREIINLLHYGNQAHLALNANDKETIIWPLQLGKIDFREVTDLSAIKKIVARNSTANGT